MGTTIMALRYSGGVMMVADSVSSRGYFVSSRFSKKGNQISPDVAKHGNIIAMRCGVAPHTQYVTKMISNYLSYHAMELQDRKIGNVCFGYEGLVVCLECIGWCGFEFVRDEDGVISKVAL